MALAPLRMTLLILAEQHAEADAGLAVALLAELVVADHLGLYRVLGVSWCCDQFERRSKLGDAIVMKSLFVAVFVAKTLSL